MMEEISLKEIIEILLKKKKLLLIAAVLPALIGLVFGLVQAKEYSADTILKVTPININPVIARETTLIGDITTLAQFPVIDLGSYTQLLLSGSVLQETIYSLELKDRKGQPISVDRLKEEITIETDEKTHMIYITAKGKTPEKAAELANTLVGRLRAHITGVVEEYCDEVSQKILRIMEAQQEKIDEETKKIQAYAENPHNALTLQSIMDKLIPQISQYRSELNDMRRSLQADRMALEGLQTVSSGIPAEQLQLRVAADNTFSENSAPLSSDNTRSGNASFYWEPEFSVDIDTNSTLSGVENYVLALRKAELETRLLQNEADYYALSTGLDDMENQLSQYMAEWAVQQQQYDILLRDYKLAGEIYGQCQKVYKQIPVIAESSFADSNIQVISYATEPDEPDNLGALIFLAAGASLGLFAGIFYVLFKHYWAET